MNAFVAAEVDAHKRGQLEGDQGRAVAEVLDGLVDFDFECIEIGAVGGRAVSGSGVAVGVAVGVPEGFGVFLNVQMISPEATSSALTWTAPSLMRRSAPGLLHVMSMS